ncbi:hypothetical protein [Paraburkholderia sp. J76]|uniref:hypothetical protein n=1 Tax=Paraburkholderia sp. J76 TaxID=2805439 RepID=UPI002ABDDCBF|nr:hypothetical protein [Paraburkholderia sp. J76]
MAEVACERLFAHYESEARDSVGHSERQILDSTIEVLSAGRGELCRQDCAVRAEQRESELPRVCGGGRAERVEIDTRDHERVRLAFLEHRNRTEHEIGRETQRRRRAEPDYLELLRGGFRILTSRRDLQQHCVDEKVHGLSRRQLCALGGQAVAVGGAAVDARQHDGEVGRNRDACDELLACRKQIRRILDALEGWRAARRRYDIGLRPGLRRILERKDNCRAAKYGELPPNLCIGLCAHYARLQPLLAQRGEEHAADGDRRRAQCGENQQAGQHRKDTLLALQAAFERVQRNGWRGVGRSAGAESAWHYAFPAASKTAWLRAAPRESAMAVGPAGGSLVTAIHKPEVAFVMDVR